MRIVVLAGFGPSLIRFRGEFLQSLVAAGYQVFAVAPDLSPATAEALRAIGVEPIVAGFDRGGLNPVRDFVALVRLVRVLKAVRGDVFLGYTIKPVIFGGIAARIAGIPRIYSLITGLGYAFVGDSATQRWVGKIARSLYRIALSSNRAVFFQNPDDLALFRNWGLLAHDRTHILNGSGVNLTYYSLAPPVVEPVSFLLVARLYREKGVYEFIAAARMVRRIHAGVRFRIVGAPDRNPHSLAQEEIDEWVREGLIEYHGWSEDVRHHYCESSVYVLPSYREGTPRTVLEAMAMGRPIITSTAPGCRETVVDGLNGWLVPVKDSAALANAMCRFIDQPQLIASMGRESRALAEFKFDVHQVNRSLMGYMELLPNDPLTPTP